MPAPVLGGGEQPAVAPQRAADEVDRRRGSVGQVGTAQHPGRNRQPLDHERIPRGENFLIARRPYAELTNFQQLGARRLDQADCARGADVRGACRLRRGAIRPRNWPGGPGRSGARTPRTPLRSAAMPSRSVSIHRICPRDVPSRHPSWNRTPPCGERISRSTQSAVSPAIRMNSASPVARAARAYSHSSRPLSYSIFSKCGIIHSASTE